MDFSKYKEAVVRYSALGRHAFDVRADASTDKTQVDELVQQHVDGKVLRYPFVDMDFNLMDGRNGALAQKRYLSLEGDKDPEIIVNQFPWKFHERSEEEKQVIKNWALEQNFAKGAYRRPATFDDEYLRVRELLANGWTERDIRNEFKSFLSAARLTNLLQKADKASKDKKTIAVRGLAEAHPKLSAAEVVKMAGFDPKDDSLLRAARTKANKRGVKERLRTHHFASYMGHVHKRIEREAQLWLDYFRDGKDGKAGISEDRYLELLRHLRGHVETIDATVNEVISRGLTEMDVPAERLDKRSKKRPISSSFSKKKAAAA